MPEEFTKVVAMIVIMSVILLWLVACAWAIDAMMEAINA